jgi:hypothetical protein
MPLLTCDDLAIKVENWIPDLIFTFAFGKNEKMVASVESILDSPCMREMVKYSWNKHKDSKKPLATRFHTELVTNKFSETLATQITACTKQPTGSLLPIKVWGLCALFLQELIYKDSFHNAMLKMMERPITSSNEALRVQALRSWGMLVRNFSAVSTFFESQSRPKLLMTPLLACLNDEKFTDKVVVRRECFEVWRVLMNAAMDANGTGKVFSLVVQPVLPHIMKEKDDELRNQLVQYLSEALFSVESDRLELSVQMLLGHFDVVVSQVLFENGDRIEEPVKEKYLDSIVQVAAKDNNNDLIEKVCREVIENGSLPLTPLLSVPMTTLSQIKDKEGQPILAKIASSNTCSPSQPSQTPWSQTMQTMRGTEESKILLYSQQFEDFVSTVMASGDMTVWRKIAVEITHDLETLYDYNIGDTKSFIEKHETNQRDNGSLSPKIMEPRCAKLIIEVLSHPIKVQQNFDNDGDELTIEIWTDLARGYGAFHKVINSPPFNYPSKQQRQDVGNTSIWIDKIASEMVETMQFQKAIIVSSDRNIPDKWLSLCVSLAGSVLKMASNHDSLNAVVSLVSAILDICDAESIYAPCLDAFATWMDTNCKTLKQAKSCVETVMGQSALSIKVWHSCLHLLETNINPGCDVNVLLSTLEPILLWGINQERDDRIVSDTSSFWNKTVASQLLTSDSVTYPTELRKRFTEITKDRKDVVLTLPSFNQVKQAPAAKKTFLNLKKELVAPQSPTRPSSPVQKKTTKRKRVEDDGEYVRIEPDEKSDPGPLTDHQLEVLRERKKLRLAISEMNPSLLEVSLSPNVQDDDIHTPNTEKKDDVEDLFNNLSTGCTPTNKSLSESPGLSFTHATPNNAPASPPEKETSRSLFDRMDDSDDEMDGITPIKPKNSDVSVISINTTTNGLDDKDEEERDLKQMLDELEAGSVLKLSKEDKEAAMTDGNTSPPGSILKKKKGTSTPFKTVHFETMESSTIVELLKSATQECSNGRLSKDVLLLAQMEAVQLLTAITNSLNKM